MDAHLKGENASKTIQCDGCIFRFESASKLYHHKLSSNKALKCEHCCQGYDRYEDFRKHYDTCHPDEKQPPKYCPKHLVVALAEAKTAKKTQETKAKDMDPNRKSKDKQPFSGENICKQSSHRRSKRTAERSIPINVTNKYSATTNATSPPNRVKGSKSLQNTPIISTIDNSDHRQVLKKARVQPKHITPRKVVESCEDSENSVMELEVNHEGVSDDSAVFVQQDDNQCHEINSGRGSTSDYNDCTQGIQTATAPARSTTLESTKDSSFLSTESKLEFLLCLWKVPKPVRAQVKYAVHHMHQTQSEEFLRCLMCDFDASIRPEETVKLFKIIAESTSPFVSAVLCMDYMKRLSKQDLLLFYNSRSLLPEDVAGIIECYCAFLFQKLNVYQDLEFVKKLDDQMIEKIKLNFISLLTPSSPHPPKDISTNELQISHQTSGLLLQLMHSCIGDACNDKMTSVNLGILKQMTKFVNTFMQNILSIGNADSAFMVLLREAQRNRESTVEMEIQLKCGSMSVFVHEILLEVFSWKNPEVKVPSIDATKQDVQTFVEILYSNQTEKHCSKISLGVCLVAQAVGIGNICKLLFKRNEIPINTLIHRNPNSVLPILFFLDKQEEITVCIQRVVAGYKLNGYTLDSFLKDLPMNQMQRCMQHPNMDLPDEEKIHLLISWSHHAVNVDYKRGSLSQIRLWPEAVATTFSKLVQGINPAIMSNFKNQLRLSEC